MSEQLDHYMMDDPDGTIESIATEFKVSHLEVIKRIKEAVIVDSSQFDTVWEAIQSWGKMTFITHVYGSIIEVKGDIPKGTHARGYFNLRGGGEGLTGHLKVDALKNICFVERNFMGSKTYSILFITQEGDIAFKIFLGRDKKREFLPGQVEAFKSLAHNLQSN